MSFNYDSKHFESSTTIENTFTAHFGNSTEPVEFSKTIEATPNIKVEDLPAGPFVPSTEEQRQEYQDFYNRFLLALMADNLIKMALGSGIQNLFQHTILQTPQLMNYFTVPPCPPTLIPGLNPSTPPMKTPTAPSPALNENPQNTLALSKIDSEPEKPFKNNDGIKVALANSSEWKQFDEQQNEMLVLNHGRNLFPILELHIDGLKPTQQYCVGIHCILESRFKQYYNSGLGKWLEATTVGRSLNGDLPTNEVFSRILTGENMMRYVDLTKIKIYKRGNQKRKESLKRPSKYGDSYKVSCQTPENMIKTDLLFKYLPVIRIYEVQGAEKKMVYETSFRETIFITVSGYKNEKLIKLKRNNKFSRESYRT